MEELNKIIVNNLVKYRKNAKLTQLELAEKLMYSDKNVSKWERGDSVPDVVILKQLADIYGITVNDFLVEKEEIVLPKKESKKEKAKFLNKNQILILSLSVGLVWLVAILAYGVLKFIPPVADFAWRCFVLAIPVTSIVVLVFTSIWCTNLLNCIVVGFLIWTVALALFVCIDVPEMWLIFIVAIPLQVLDILWFLLRKVKKISKKEQEKQESDIGENK